MAQTTQTIIAAPIGGENGRDPLANMPETDAERLVNTLPEQGYLRLRGGYEGHATAGAGSVERLFPYNNQDGTSDLIACANGKIYDATATGAATQLATGFSLSLIHI